MHADGDESESVGQRVQRLRREREMTEAELGDPVFSAAFVGAVEAGHYQPSAIARGILAQRLAIPETALRDLPAPTAAPPHLEALGEDLRVQFAEIRPRLYADPRAFLEELAALLAPYDALFPQLPVRVRYQVHYLRANAYLRSGQLDAAEPEIHAAMPLAEQVEDSGQEVERVRNALGALYYLRDQPARALEVHRRCLHAVQRGVVKDLTLSLVIYTSVANDYWAVNDAVQAAGIYHEALAHLADVDYPDRQAEILTGLSIAYYTLGELDRAREYAEQALAIHETLGRPRGIGRIATNLAGILIAQGEYEQVEALLARSLELLTAPEDDGPRSEAWMSYALLELHRGNVDAAAWRAGEALRMAASEFADQDAGVGILARAFVVRTYARALAVAGQVAERRGQLAEADTLFQQALALLERSEYAETACEIAHTYADLLVARGDHAQAGVYYRLAYTRSRRRS